MTEILTFTLALAIGYASIALLQPLCLVIGHVDSPGGHKRHNCQTPLCGGFGVVVAVLAAGSVAGLSSTYAGLAVGLAFLTVVGAIDDSRPISAVPRLTIHCAVALLCLVLIGEVYLLSLGDLFAIGPLELGWLSIPFTVFAVVGVLNSVNMIDGIDGLAGSYALLILAVFAANASGAEQHLLLAYLGGLVAFLWFNLRRPGRSQATAFLGDVGSLAVAFGMVWFAVSLSQGDDAALRPITMVWLFGLPLVDTGYLMGSRFVLHGNPLRADRRHFHHLLLRRLGMRPGLVCVTWLAVASGFVFVGLFGEYLRVSGALMFYLFCGIFIWYFAVMAYSWNHVGKKRGSLKPVTKAGPGRDNKIDPSLQ